MEVFFKNQLIYSPYTVHDVIRDVERKKEREKERKTPKAMEKWKMRVASGGIRTYDTLYSRQMLYQLSYMYMYIVQYVHVHVHVSY